MVVVKPSRRCKVSSPKTNSIAPPTQKGSELSPSVESDGSKTEGCLGNRDIVREGRKCMKRGE
jgi:hypothetical protein